MSMITDKDKRKGIIGTIIFHMVLLLALLILALRTPLPLPGEEGVEVIFGYTETGFGEVIPENPVSQTRPVPVPVSQPEEEIVEEIVTQTTDESLVIPDTKPEREIENPAEEKPEEEIEEVITPEPEPIEEIPQQPEVNQRALFKGSQSSNEEGGASGIAGGGGSQGQPDGLRQVQRYDGQGGQGDGPSYSLGGRGSKYLEQPSANFQEQGDVVVDIWVDRKGNVKRALVSVRGTTILDANLRNTAIKAAYNSTFSEDPKAPDLQKGTITYTFIIRR
jgi:outer membrane biosynthesis protein TonB